MALIQPRGIIFTILALIALALACAAAGTDMFKADVPVSQSVGANGQQNTRFVTGHFQSFRTCLDDGGSRDCSSDRIPDCQVSKFRAIRAFQLLTIIFLFFGLILGLLDIISKLPLPLGRFLEAAMMTMAVICSIIAWAIIASLWRNDCAGNSYQNLQNSKWGPSLPLLVIVTFLSLVNLLLALFIRGRVSEDVVVAQPATHNAPVVHTQQNGVNQPYGAQPVAPAQRVSA